MKKIAYVLLFAFLFDFFAPIHTVFADVVYQFNSGEYHVVYIKDNESATTCDNISTVTYDESNIEYVKSFDKIIERSLLPPTSAVTQISI